MSRIRFIPENETASPSRGSSGFRRSAEALVTAGHATHDIAAFQARITELEGQLWRLQATLVDRDAEIASLKAQYDEMDETASVLTHVGDELEKDYIIALHELGRLFDDPVWSKRVGVHKAEGWTPPWEEKDVRENEGDVREIPDVRENEEGIVRTPKGRGRPKKDDADKPWTALGMNERTYRRKKAKGEIK